MRKSVRPGQQINWFVLLRTTKLLAMNMTSPKLLMVKGTAGSALTRATMCAMIRKRMYNTFLMQQTRKDLMLREQRRTITDYDDTDHTMMRTTIPKTYDLSGKSTKAPLIST